MSLDRVDLLLVLLRLFPLFPLLPLLLVPEEATTPVEFGDGHSPATTWRCGFPLGIVRDCVYLDLLARFVIPPLLNSTPEHFSGGAQY
ncbi:uncharacterized protein K444DRAFT_613361 [Hyaloscypha bicolor E]|uniref:Secreted peptide n=1 Tax=Hyaloscypha bicolor E TaxID=1095630 RepID=A0A2J6T8T0_9HELO|nr:uncharacterized protein K444DRAFT_613361 [Hyaloscypha bicolor E]PMD59388.1 hypothetical protein K444DRAFT_613361 [Hyaloscypha bicolor E]